MRREEAISGDDYATQWIVAVRLRDELLVRASAVENFEGDCLPRAGELVTMLTPNVLGHYAGEGGRMT